MPRNHKKKSVVLITGATSGIGAACCRRFAAAGANVIAVGRRGTRLTRLAEALDPACHPLMLDVRDTEAVDEAIASLPDPFREIDVLINNAGLALGPASLLEGLREDWWTMIDTNIRGVINVTSAVVAGMASRNCGHIFNVGSIGGAYPAGSTVYGGTKAFIHHFSLALRRDLLGRMIRVTCVIPGSTDTEFRAVRQKRERSNPQSRRGGILSMSGDEMAEAIFMCHRLPAHVNVNRIELMPVGQGFGDFTFIG